MFFVASDLILQLGSLGAPSVPLGFSVPFLFSQDRLIGEEQRPGEMRSSRDERTLSGFRAHIGI